MEMGLVEGGLRHTSNSQAIVSEHSPRVVLLPRDVWYRSRERDTTDSSSSLQNGTV